MLLDVSAGIAAYVYLYVTCMHTCYLPVWSSSIDIYKTTGGYVFLDSPGYLSKRNRQLFYTYLYYLVMYFGSERHAIHVLLKREARYLAHAYMRQAYTEFVYIPVHVYVQKYTVHVYL
jgi:hypothetical protein